MHTRYFALFLLMGCLGDAEEVELADTESEIVGGVATTLRPEIGRYTSSAGSCTATLIGPSLVITAAHCLTPQYTGLVPQNGFFRFTDVSGIPRDVSVDRIHSFATRRFERPFPGSPFTTDVALLHLISPVPSTWATPAALALQEPAIGDTSTTFGFGCTSRDPQVGAGMKRMFTFSYGSQTRALCWGDSGGPTAFGTTGPIWGINSDFDWTFPNWLTNSWLDLFANVPMYRKQIEDISRAWEGGLEPGTDRFGLDYFVERTPSAQVCKANCEKDGACRAFTWRSTTQDCWRKTGVPEPTPGVNLVSGLPSRLEWGIDRFGADFGSVSASSPDACASACAQNASCKSWTHLGNACFFKSAVAPAVAGSCPLCTSGVPARGQETNIDRPGPAYAIVSASTPFQCANTCARDARCESYTHVGSSCFLRDLVPAAVPVSPGAFITSGVKRGIETNSDRPGATFFTLNTDNLTPNACQALCAQNAICQAWTYTPPTTSNAMGVCALKNAVTQRQVQSGMVSGLRGLEMMP